MVFFLFKAALSYNTKVVITLTSFGTTFLFKGKNLPPNFECSSALPYVTMGGNTSVLCSLGVEQNGEIPNFLFF